MALSKIQNSSMADNTIHGRRNLVINGAMQVAQRATSSTSDSYSTIDRYLNETSGGTTTFSQEDVASGDAPYEKGHRKFNRMTNTTANTGTGALRRIQQRIEAQNIACSGWNYTSTDVGLTISFWARSSIAGTYYCWLYGDDSASSAIAYVPTGFALLANTWTYVTQKIKGHANLAFNNDNGVGLRIYIIAHQGTDMTSGAGSGTFDAWGAYSGTFRSGAMTQNWSHTQGATFDVTGLQAEVGSQATPFEHRSYREELALCQRYFQKYSDNGSGSGYISNGYIDNDRYYGVTRFANTLRANPTCAGTSGDFAVQSSAYSASGFSIDEQHNPTVDSVRFRTGTNSNFTNGQGAILKFGEAGSVTVDSEL